LRLQQQQPSAKHDEKHYGANYYLTRRRHQMHEICLHAVMKNLHGGTQRNPIMLKEKMPKEYARKIVDHV